MKYTMLTLPENAIEQIKSYLLQLQNNICQTLEQLDGQGHFVEDAWTRDQGGGGLTRVMHNGAVLDAQGSH